MAETPPNYFHSYFSSKRGGLQTGEGGACNRKCGPSLLEGWEGLADQAGQGGWAEGWSQILTSSPRKPPAQKSLSKMLARVQEMIVTAAATTQTACLLCADLDQALTRHLGGRALAHPFMHLPLAPALTASEASRAGTGHLRPPVLLSLKDQEICFHQISLSSLSC